MKKGGSHSTSINSKPLKNKKKILIIKFTFHNVANFLFKIQCVFCGNLNFRAKSWRKNAFFQIQVFHGLHHFLPSVVREIIEKSSFCSVSQSAKETIVVFLSCCSHLLFPCLWNLISPEYLLCVFTLLSYIVSIIHSLPATMDALMRTIYKSGNGLVLGLKYFFSCLLCYLQTW